jgi:hypothetical protein
MDYENTERIESKVAPGVVIVYYKAIEERRIELRRQAADIAAKFRSLNAEVRKLQYEWAKPDIDEPTKEDLMVRQENVLEQQHTIMITELNPLYLRWGIKAVEGLKVNGVEIKTPDALLHGPGELYAETIKTIHDRLGLNDDQIKNLSSPTTSTGQAGGKTSDTTAPSVETLPIASTVSETAPSTSPVTLIRSA